MQLRSKLLLILFGAFVLYATLASAVQRFVMYPYFAEVERRESTKEATRAVAALNREIDALRTICHDWSAWNAACQFVADRNPEFVRSTLTPDTFDRLSIHLLYLCDPSGKVIWGSVREPRLNRDHPARLADFPPDVLPASSRLISHADSEPEVAGVLTTECGPMIVASAPVLAGNRQGPVRGSLIMGRFLNDEMIRTVSRQAGVSFSVWPLRNGFIPPDERQIAPRLSGTPPFHMVEYSPYVLRVYTSMPDVYGSTALLIRANVPRIITANVQAAMRFALLFILAAGLVVLLVMHSSLRRIVLEPLSELTTCATAIAQNDDLSTRLVVRHPDEIGTLAQEFNRMLEQLALARRHLLEQSYYSGKAEMAAGVLHNIRNSLNPIVVQIDGLQEEIRGIPIEAIQRAQTELLEGTPPADRRRDLTEFLHLANSDLKGLVSRTTDRLNELSGQATRIERILLDHDGLQKAKPPLEEVRLNDLVRDAQTLMPQDLRRNLYVEVDASMNRIGPVRGHRISLLQVFANLLVNAAESIQQWGTPEGRIEISATVDTQDGTEMVHVRFRDNGGASPRRMPIASSNGASRRNPRGPVSDCTGAATPW
jgi:two-component system, NtrC family, sensor kinase